VKAEKLELLPSKAPFSKRFEEAVGQACESAPVRALVAVAFVEVWSIEIHDRISRGKLHGERKEGNQERAP
jgi:hypothetical protein